MNKFIPILVVVFLAFTAWYYIRNPLSAQVRIHDHVFTIEIAATPREKQRGLGGRESLPRSHGMLFPYDHADYHQFWMKDTLIPLDFVWIKDRTVVDLTENVPVATSSVLPIYKPKEPVDNMLELNAGEIKEFGIEIGDSVEFIN